MRFDHILALLLAFVVFFAFVLVPGQSQEQPQVPSATTTVVASGVGLDGDKALKNALSNAVQQAVGLVVDAETFVTNDDVVRDQILTYSDGYVESYDKVHESKREDGLSEITISAIVKRRQLIEKLKAANIRVTEVDGASLFAEVLTQNAADKDAAKLLAEAFEGLPRKLLYAEVVNQKPTIIEKNDQEAMCSWSVEIGYDVDAYYNSIMPQLRKVLDDISIRKSSIELIGKTEDFGYNIASIEIRDSTISLIPETTFDPSDMPNVEDRNDLLVILNVRANKRRDNLGFAWYVVDKTTCGSIFEQTFAQKFKVRLEFLDMNNAPVRVDDIDLSGRDYHRAGIAFSAFAQQKTSDVPSRVEEVFYKVGFPYFLTSNAQYSTEYTKVFVRPFLRGYSLYGGEINVYSELTRIEKQVILGLDEMKQIARVKAAIIGGE